MTLGLVLLLVMGATPTTSSTVAQAPRIDLVTMGVGGALYSIFGHAAIRVVHPDGRDITYNFGGVNIEIPFFWVSLMRGRVKAYLEVGTYADLLLRYSGEDRTIVGRTLDFSPEQARNIVKKLDAIATDENARHYYYHHVLDNCTTRVAKVFDEAIDGALARQSQSLVRGTYRDWIISRVRDRPFLYVVMDLTGNGLGDVPITAWDATFLPDGLDRVIDNARIGDRAFVKAKYLDYKSLSFDKPVLWDWPWTKVYIMFLVPFLAIALWRPRIATFIWGILTGALGSFYVVLWIGSDYAFLHKNWNMLNFPPTHLLLAFVSARASWWARFRRGRERYLLAQLIALVVLTVCFIAGIVAQAIAPMLWISVPVALALGLRPLFLRSDRDRSLAEVGAPDLGVHQNRVALSR